MSRPNAVFVLLALLGGCAYFSVSTESDAVGTPASSLYGCDDDSECTEENEACYTDVDCDDDDDDCIAEEGDYSCHRDCTDDEKCSSGEDCVYVGDERWLCLE